MGDSEQGDGRREKERVGAGEGGEQGAEQERREKGREGGGRRAEVGDVGRELVEREVVWTEGVRRQGVGRAYCGPIEGVRRRAEGEPVEVVRPGAGAAGSSRGFLGVGVSAAVWRASAIRGRAARSLESVVRDGRAGGWDLTGAADGKSRRRGCRFDSPVFTFIGLVLQGAHRAIRNHRCQHELSRFGTPNPVPDRHISANHGKRVARTY